MVRITLLIVWTVSFWLAYGGTGLLSATAAEPGWPQWRGPRHDGQSSETGLVDQWPNSGPPILWARDIGQGYSGFAAVGDRIYTQTQTLYEQAVICLEGDTGRQLWSYRYGWPYAGGGLYPGPRATPTWYQDKVYFAAPDGTIGCLTADRGQRVWSRNLKQEFHGKGTDFGCSSSPLVVSDRVIVPVGGTGASVVALDAETGKTIWSTGDEAASYCTPVPIEFQGRQFIVTFMENTLAGFDLETGVRVWNVEFSQGYDEHAAAPLYQEPDLMIASPFRSGAKQYRLVSSGKPGAADHKIQLERTWEAPRFSNDVASSVLVENHVFGFDLHDAQSRLNRPSRGEFRCLDFATGRELWSTKLVGQANIIVADGKLILFGDDGSLVLARASADAYQELARTSLFEGEVCWTPPALQRGRLWVRTQTRALCVYLGAQPLAASQPVSTVADLPQPFKLDHQVLLGGEREFPATTPEWTEFFSWYAVSGQLGLGAVLTGGLVALISWLTVSWRTVSWRTVGWRTESTHRDPWYAGRTGWRSGLWVALLAGGICGSPLLNSRLEVYVFTWPLALWTTFQLTLMTIVWCESHPERRRLRWRSRGVGLLFMMVCAAYFHFCWSLGMGIEWAYLIGLLPAFPLAALAAYPLMRPTRWFVLTDSTVAAVSFSGYFWLSAFFMKWWFVVGS